MTRSSRELPARRPTDVPSVVTFDVLPNGATLFYACSVTNPDMCCIGPTAGGAQDALNTRAQYGSRWADADEPGAVDAVPQYVADNGARIWAAIAIVALVLIVWAL